MASILSYENLSNTGVIVSRTRRPDTHCRPLLYRCGNLNVSHCQDRGMRNGKQGKRWTCRLLGIVNGWSLMTVSIPSKDNLSTLLRPSVFWIPGGPAKANCMTWPVHLAEKSWVDIEAFIEVFIKAIEIHKGKYTGEVDPKMLAASIEEARALARHRTSQV